MYSVALPHYSNAENIKQPFIRNQTWKPESIMKGFLFKKSRSWHGNLSVFNKYYIMSYLKKSSQEVNQVYKTNDLSIFKSLDGNRNVIESHLKRLCKSMKSNLLFSPIIVNEKMEVIDGQHRLMASKINKTPLEYIIVKGYGLKEVQILNANSKNWSSDDYMNGYCDLNYSDYKIYREFKQTYGFGHSECQALLSNATNSSMQPIFNSGSFKIENYEKAVDMAEKITMTSVFYTGYKRRSYVFALMQLFNNENFEFTQFIQKLKIQPAALVDCTTISTYLLLIEEIYNYRSRNKVSLRY